jgi:hypothetical protein
VRSRPRFAATLVALLCLAPIGALIGSVLGYGDVE